MSKAYDRVEWKFLEIIMLAMGFDVKFVDVVLRCISTVSFFTVINGKPVDFFLPSRGLRQGDPFSHLFVAYNSFIFGDASHNQAIEVRCILATYEAASGQQINLEKILMGFRKNTRVKDQDVVKQILGVGEVEKHGKYLGLPVVTGKSKKEIFDDLQEWV